MIGPSRAYTVMSTMLDRAKGAVVARRCKGCGRRLSGSADAESCPLCEPTMKVRQARRAARREAEQRVTQRWGSQDPVKIARECGIDMSGPMDRGGDSRPSLGSPRATAADVGTPLPGTLALVTASRATARCWSLLVEVRCTQFPRQLRPIGDVTDSSRPG